MYHKMIKWKKINIDWEYELDKFKGDVKRCGIFSVAKSEIFKKHVSHKTISEKARQYSVPLDKKIREKINKKNKLWAKFKNPTTINNEEVYMEYQKLRNQVRRSTRKAHKQYEKEIVEQM